MKFEWDEEKNKINIAKHHVSFGNIGDGNIGDGDNYCNKSTGHFGKKNGYVTHYCFHIIYAFIIRNRKKFEFDHK